MDPEVPTMTPQPPKARRKSQNFMDLLKKFDKQPTTEEPLSLRAPLVESTSPLEPKVMKQPTDMCSANQPSLAIDCGNQAEMLSNLITKPQLVDSGIVANTDRDPVHCPESEKGKFFRRL